MAAFERSWNVWPPGPQNTVGSVRVEAGQGRNGSAGLHVRLRAPPAGHWPDFHIFHQANLALHKGHRYRVSVRARAEPTAAGRRLGLDHGFGVAQCVEPLLAAADATPDETLATYPDGSAAVALRNADGSPSLFVGPPGLTSELLRIAARRAEVHLHSQADCNVYANGPYLVLHAAQDGPLEIDVRKSGPVRDILTGQTIGRGPKMAVPLRKGETRVLAIEEHSP